LTLAPVTPGTAVSAFSTRPMHEAQLMPSIANVTVSCMSGLTGAFITLSSKNLLESEDGASSVGKVKARMDVLLAAGERPLHVRCDRIENRPAGAGPASNGGMSASGRSSRGLKTASPT
jgi:hypothetical protein